MATITITLDDEDLAAVRAAAVERGVPIEAVLRTAILQSLARDQADEPRLSQLERLLLKTQQEILEFVTNNGRDRHHDFAEILGQGFTGRYGEVFSELGPEISQADCSLVEEILEMSRQVKNSLDRLDESHRGQLDDGVEDLLTFAGFDGNDPYESALGRYAGFLTDHGQWQEFTGGSNSHAEMVPSYKRMLAVYTPIWRGHLLRKSGPEKYKLAVDELNAIAAAF